MTNRRGFTLIEMITVIWVSSIVLLVGVGTIHMLLRSERLGSKTLMYSASFSRLSRQFRHDVRWAIKAEAIDEQDARPPHLRLAAADDRTILYQPADDALLCIEEVGGEISRREMYRLPPHSTVRFELPEEPTSGMIVLVLQRSVGEGKSPRPQRIVRVEALLAKDHRWEGQNR